MRPRVGKAKITTKTPHQLKEKPPTRKDLEDMITQTIQTLFQSHEPTPNPFGRKPKLTTSLKRDLERKLLEPEKLDPQQQATLWGGETRRKISAYVDVRKKLNHKHQNKEE